jgi:FkbM family methyltransferase
VRTKLDTARIVKAVRHLDRIPEILRCRGHAKEWRTLSSAYLGLNSAFPFEVTLPSGRFLFCESSDVATFWQIFYRNIYPVRISDRVIIDAGGNIGAFTLFALLNAPGTKVIAIEPATDTCVRFRAMLAEHKLEHRCALHEAALAGAAGETTIQLNVGSQFRRSGLPGQRVAAMTLDSLIPDDEPVDFLKMDIEGAEYEVLNTTPAQTLRRIGRIALEYHPQAPYERALQPLLTNGFRLVKLQEDGGGYGVAWLEQEAAKRQVAGNTASGYADRA